jgi:peptide/nickel transport system permease protein
VTNVSDPVAGPTGEPDSALTVAVLSRRQRWWRSLKLLYSRPASAIGTTIVLLFLLIALIGPFIAPYGANEQIYTEARQPPSTSHLFGTDRLGRDVFSRVILGARDIFALAGLGTLLAVITGTVFGLTSGYLGGYFDEGLMRFFDTLLAIPALLLALLLLGTVGPSRNSILIVIVIVYTPIIARVVRSVVLTVRPMGFVEASRTQGESLPWILYRVILPSVTPALTVETALRFSYAIFLVASLGFLGIGVQPPNPDWGLMVSEARHDVTQTPWALYFPAAAIAILVIGVNLMADGLKRLFQAPADE